MALTETADFKGMSDADKIIVRSNGTVTYVGKDMAYQLWKFGLLGRDFHYRSFENPLYPLWRTDAHTSDEGAPSFGGGDTVINVIDVRQSYLQKIVKEGLRQMGHGSQADRSIHFAYEMVALVQKTAAEFERAGQIRLSDEDKARPYVEMSGRKGLGVQADALLDLLVEKAGAEIRKREPDLPEEEIAARARALAMGALRYYMVKYGQHGRHPLRLRAGPRLRGRHGALPAVRLRPRRGHPAQGRRAGRRRPRPRPSPSQSETSPRPSTRRAGPSSPCSCASPCR